MQKEAIQQEAVIQYCDAAKIPIYAIPNGGHRNQKEAYFMKRSGVRAGVPDLFVPLARKDYHGLYIEMKVKPNKPTEKQKEWLDRLERNGYCCSVCYSAADAIKLLNWYAR